MHPACLDEDRLLSQCKLGRSRTGGPGGQHRNKVETKVTITHLPTGVIAQAGERRSVVENRRMALLRLRLLLAVKVRLPVPAGECRSALWMARCSGGRVSCNPEHQDFPALLAEALDVLHSAGWDPRTASLRLECSATQLVRLVKDHPPAFQHWNQEREARGLHALR